MRRSGVKNVFSDQNVKNTENWKVDRKNQIFTLKIWEKSGRSARMPTKFTFCFGDLLFTFGSEKWKNVFFEKWTYLGRFSPILAQTLIECLIHTPLSIPDLTSSRYLLEPYTLDIVVHFFTQVIATGHFSISRNFIHVRSIPLPRVYYKSGDCLSTVLTAKNLQACALTGCGSGCTLEVFRVCDQYLYRQKDFSQ